MLIFYVCFYCSDCVSGEAEMNDWTKMDVDIYREAWDCLDFVAEYRYLHVILLEWLSQEMWGGRGM